MRNETEEIHSKIEEERSQPSGTSNKMVRKLSYGN